MGTSAEPSVVSLHELVGAIGAHQWRKNGVYVEALQGRIHPHYGTFFPTRSEYVDLVAAAPLPSDTLAFDVGTGTGVLAAVLARRGVKRVVATDNEPRAIACATENFRHLGVQDRAEAVLADMFPAGRAPLIVCNPPWIPATPHSSLDNAVYDPGSRMLFRFLNELSGHLEPGGEGWLVLSDLAEHLGLRTRDQLLGAIDSAGLKRAGTARHPANPPQGIRPERSLVRGPGGRGHLAVAARRPLASRSAARIIALPNPT